MDDDFIREDESNRLSDIVEVPEGEHHRVLTYTRSWRHGFRKRYWVRCLTCDVKDGPFEEAWVAREALRLANLLRFDRP